MAPGEKRNAKSKRRKKMASKWRGMARWRQPGVIMARLWHVVAGSIKMAYGEKRNRKSNEIWRYQAKKINIERKWRKYRK